MKARSVSLRALLPVFALSSATAVFAVTPPAVRISDGTNTVTIDSTGTVTLSAGCACSTTAVSATPGTITWSGTVGAYTITGLTAETKPTIAPPSLDVGISSLTSNAASGALTVSFTDTNFTGQPPETLTALTNYFGSGSTTYSGYVDASNQPFGMTTLVGTIPSVTGPVNQTFTTPLPSGMFSMTEVETITLGAGGSYSNDFGFDITPGQAPPPPSPMVSLMKTASSQKVNPFQKVTYTYTVKNTGNVTLTNLTVTDDNGTPNYKGDDFTVCTIASLAPMTSQTCTATVYPPVKECSNDSYGSYGPWGCGYNFDYNHTHVGGTLICKQKPNGNIEFTYLVDNSTADNTYGTGSSSDWGWLGGQSWNLLNAGAEFQVMDGSANKVLDFVTDYISPNWSAPSGFSTTGVQATYYGNSANVVSVHTTISDDLNQGKPYNSCLFNSPSNSPNWEKNMGYKVEINCNAFGSKGFGGVSCPVIKHVSKGYNCGQHMVKPCSSQVTNTATVEGYYNSTEVMATAQATVTIDASPQGWSQCGKY
jgi:hypothetical protein